ncbi:MAG: hypothetical protein U9N38_06110 [Thermodesulfobacteriota bacterium]|nr:hypothetical protein [Thermodesulfobacteriota bacterium]
MKNLTTAIYSLATTDAVGSGFMASIGNRLYENVAPEGAEFPYCVYMIISDYPEYPGGKTIEEVMIQFSIFSTSSSASEIKDILSYLRTLYDDCSLTITDNTLIYFIREQLTTMMDEVTTPAGTIGVQHYVQEYTLEMTT